MKIPIGISKKHIHLTREVYEKLFGNDNLEIRNDLNQPGEFASTSVVDIKWNDKLLERARIVGPFRSYNQIEITRSEAEYLGINPPVRKSGDVDGTHPIILVGPKGEVTLEKGLMIAQRHIHIDSKSSKEFSLENEDEILVYKKGQEIYNAFVKILDPSFLELHLDIDEAARYNLAQGDIVEIFKVQK